MEGMEDKLSAILNNPQLMQQIMTMAQSLGSGQPPQEEPATPSTLPDFDPSMLQKVMGIAGQLRADPNQQALLCALKPYLSAGRIEKLEKAMRAAKLAGVASAAFSSGALSFLTGR